MLRGSHYLGFLGELAYIDASGGVFVFGLDWIWIGGLMGLGFDGFGGLMDLMVLGLDGFDGWMDGWKVRRCRYRWGGGVNE